MFKRISLLNWGQPQHLSLLYRLGQKMRFENSLFLQVSQGKEPFVSANIKPKSREASIERSLVLTDKSRLYGVLGLVRRAVIFHDEGSNKNSK